MSELTKNQKFKLVWKEINEKAETNSAFSKKEFAELTAAFLNDKEQEVIWVKGYDDENNPKLDTIRPVEKFRNILVKILVKAKVDKQDAVAIVDAYDFSRADGEVFYEIFSEILEQYLRTGKSFKGIPKEDLKYSLGMETTEDKIYTGTNEFLREKDADGNYKGDIVEYKTEVKGCSKIRATNTTPKNLKIKIK